MHPEDADLPPPQTPPHDRRALLAGISGLAAGALLAGARTAHVGPVISAANAATATSPIANIVT